MPTFQQISVVIALSLFSSSVFSSSYYQEEIDEDYEKILTKKFLKKIDKNNDKKISFDEFLAYKTEKNQQRLNLNIKNLFNRCDKNKDDKIDKTEAIKIKADDGYAGYTPYISRKKQPCFFNTDRLIAYDKNKDGFLDRTEAIDAVNYAPNKELKKKQESRAKQQQNNRAKESFTRCDKNKDQQLSLREAASMNCNMVTEQFDAHDKDKNGYLSLKERLLDIKYSDYAHQQGSTDYATYTNYSSSSYASYKPSPLELLQRSFDACDKNEDGRLAKSETISKDCTQEMWFFNQTDRDEDGFINNSELQTAVLKGRFDAMDTNKNGILEGKEFKGSKVRYL